MTTRKIDSRVVPKSYDRMALDYHGSRLAKTDKNIAFLDGLAEHWPPAGTVLDLGRPGDDAHLFVLARRAGGDRC